MKKYKGYYTFTKVTLLKAIDFILNNGFVVFGDFMLRQERGIIMQGRQTRGGSAKNSKPSFNSILILNEGSL